jgi:tetratricopeptide (TPR) repeat protein
LSRDELQAAQGKGKDGTKSQKIFFDLMKRKWPWANCDWPKIFKELDAQADVLPLRSEHAALRVEKPFQMALESFAREVLSFPQELNETSRNVLRSHRDAIDFVLNVLDGLLTRAEQEPEKQDKKEQKDKNDPFLWKHVLSTEIIPKDLEEQAADLYERGAFETAWQVFALLVRVFPDYTDGYNFLGLIRMEEERYDEARTFFELGVASGRKRLPLDLRKVDWSDEKETAPYLRALRNLALICERSGRFEQALEVCEHLRSDCHDIDSADSYTATTYLKMERWTEARNVAARLMEALPEFGIVAAIAAAQENKDNEAAEYLVTAAQETPRVVAECFGIRLPRPKSVEDREEQDYAEDFADDVAPVLEALPSLKRNVLTGMARDLITSARIRRPVVRK